MAKPEVDPIEVVNEFVAKAVRQKWTIYLGIDPGAEGAIGMLCGDLFAVVDIPTIKVKTKKSKKCNKKDRAKGITTKTKTIISESSEFNFPAIVDIFRALKPVKDRISVVLEKGQVAGPSNYAFGKFKGINATTAHKTGIAFGMWLLYFASRGWPLEIIEPSKWKKVEGLTGKSKDASRAKALSRWPRADLKEKKHHNRAEALLLADHLRRLRGQP